MGQYYGHPQNRFWRTITAITQNDTPAKYEEKKTILAVLGIALWDVTHQAVRLGSLDSTIGDEQPNDINAFWPKIQLFAPFPSTGNTIL